MTTAKAKAAKAPKPAQFGPTYPGDYPEEMRTQLWPLCCGARIISGFKGAQMSSLEELVEEIEATIKVIPDHQVYKHEQMKPKLTFLTLNGGQMASKKIVGAIEKCGFVKFAVAQPRGGNQGFFVRDESKTFKAVEAKKTA